MGERDITGIGLCFTADFRTLRSLNVLTRAAMGLSLLRRWCRPALLLALLQLPATFALAQTTTFSYTGAAQTFTVPAGVTSVTFTVLSAGGGGGGQDANGAGGAGGSGAAVSGTYTVTPGNVLNVYVGGGGGLGASGATCSGGGVGGSNSIKGGTGGGAGCSGNSGAGGGGGAASWVSTSSGTVLLVAGGGGGGQGGAYNSNAALAGASATAIGAVSSFAAGASAATFSGDGGGGGGGGAGCGAGSAGVGHADGTNAGTAAGAGGSCANTSLISNFQTLAIIAGAGGAGTTSNASGSAGGNGTIYITYGSAQIYLYTGGVQTYTVPAGVWSIALTLNGAGGGGAGADAGGNGGNGGYGANVSGTYSVTPGSVLDIYVGGGGQGGNTSTNAYSCTTASGIGGWSDFAGGLGGEAGCSGWSGGGGGGGGASIVTTSNGTVLLVAGGGGGGQGGSQSVSGIVGGNSTSSGALPGSVGAAGIAFSGDGAGGGGGGGGCSGGAAGIGHADFQSGGTVAGAGASCANTSLVSNFQVLGPGGPGGAGAAEYFQGSTGSNGMVFISYGSEPNHYAVATPGTAVNCQPAAVTISAHDSLHNIVTASNQISMSTSTGHGDWTLTTGSGTFAAGASNSGTATYRFSVSDAGSAVFALRDTYAETVTIIVTDGAVTATSGTALASEDGPLTFAASGFRITNGANVGTTIPTQTSGVTSTQSLALQAVQTNTNTGACTAVFARGQTVNVSLAYQCTNPTTCIAGQSLSLTNNGTTTRLASNPSSGISSYTTVPLTFTTVNGEAPITLSYTDAGQISLAAKYNIPLASGAASGNTMTGSSQFVVQPYTLQLSNIQLTSSGVANPGAGSAAGSVFGAAGQAFTATVTAQNYQGNATPNFGQEIAPATVTLTPNLVVPATGDNPALAGGFNGFAGGAATGNAFSWPEVGIITLTPMVASYLGNITALIGTTSGNIGRFIPNAFSTAPNVPQFATPCSAGRFGYVGQPFVFSVAPVIIVTALTVAGTPAKNYKGSLMRLANSSLTGRSYQPTPANPPLTLSGLPAASSDPAIADIGAGQSTLTFSAGSGISFTRGSAIAPFSANIALSINVVDLDGVTASNPVTFGSGSGIAFSNNGASQVYGRLALQSSVGSELLDLPVPLTTQYYQNGAQGFTTNTSDVCTAAPAIGLINYLPATTSGDTCVRDSGSPGVSGQGCPVAGSSLYSSTASAGAFNLILKAPGSGNSLAVTVTATAPSWLQYPWNTSTGFSSPTGLATFGLFPGSQSRVHQREVY